MNTEYTSNGKTYTIQQPNNEVNGWTFHSIEAAQIFISLIARGVLYQEAAERADKATGYVN